MITTKHLQDTLVTESRYDRGTHLGFTVNLLEENSYNYKTLDQLLDPKEIKSIELLISSIVKGYLEGSKL